MTTPLADELLLLAHDDSGKPSRNDGLDLGLAGAVLMELALAGRMDVVDKKAVVIDQAGNDPDERTAALVALVRAVGLRKQVFPGGDRRQVEAQMKQIGEGAWAAEAVRKAIADIQTGIIAAVAVSSAAASAGADGG